MVKEIDASSSENTYRLRVVATDGGSPPMSSECEVTVTLVNENIHAPHFENANDTELAIPRQINVGTKIYTINATDEDSDKITFSITNGMASEYFFIDQFSGDITVIKALNEFQEDATITIEIIAKDNGAPILQTTSGFKLLVTGENVYPPFFQVMY